MTGDKNAQGGKKERPSASSVTYRTFRDGDAQGVVDVMNAAYPAGWGDMKHWKAKRGEHPDFRAEEIFVAECEGRIVGCLHTDLRPVHLGNGVTVWQSMDGDLAAHPDYRGLGIPEELYRRSSIAYRDKAIEVRGGFANELLWTRFYRPKIGYSCGFDRSRGFTKLLTSRELAERLIATLGESKGDAADPSAPVLEIRLRDTEPICIELREDGVRRVDPPAGRGLVVEADQRILNLGRGGSVTRARLLLRLLITGKIRFRRLFTAGPRVARWIMRHRGSLGRRAR